MTWVRPPNAGVIDTAPHPAAALASRLKQDAKRRGRKVNQRQVPRATARMSQTRTFTHPCAFPPTHSMHTHSGSRIAQREGGGKMINLENLPHGVSEYPFFLERNHSMLG